MSRPCMWFSAHITYRIKLLAHIHPSLDSQVLQKYHPNRAAMMTAVTATKILIDGFEIRKQNNSSAIENVTILYPSGDP